ncbi:MAG: pyruvate carboxylase subunit B [Oscillibacter ruminantium]|uniref:pyruvate carboxylase subunit B n=1 Tax=Oscillibacter ruminantium TaxID=1263547 RepID=UPI002B220CCB|nr:pyruvate carboxylase subunit B [Oscillibacter ruminantium]MEA5042582.1 pyruvate carboxylase subunit B [Oscillibacter ruminantium]
MEFLSSKPLLITDTILRDAHQSHAATRMRLEDMLPACEILDSIGYYSLECWGGATFDACMRYLDEDPWDRLRALRRHLPHTKLQMLFRGQSILGYRNYADDVVDSFCAKSIENGIDIVRVFDALNDPRNLEQALRSVKKYGGLAEAAISYTVSPIHDEAYFLRLAQELAQMGADSICIKDMANLLSPMAAYSLVKRLKETVTLPIHLHTHDSAGTGAMVNLMAAVAGADIVDTALSPLAGGVSQPATESMVAALKGTPRDTGLDLSRLGSAAAHFRTVAASLEQAGFLDSRVLRVDASALIWQVPGGMLSNLIAQLRQIGREELYESVLAEIPSVRRDFGYPPLVTPSSQIIGSQAVLNVVTGKRYQMFSKESKAMLRGEYGQLPGPVNPEVLQKAGIREEDRITCRPADLLQPELPASREKYKALAQSEEDVLSLALFPQVAEEFLMKKRQAE